MNENGSNWSTEICYEENGDHDGGGHHDDGFRVHRQMTLGATARRRPQLMTWAACDGGVVTKTLGTIANSVEKSGTN